jgi:4-azaleucine resistance transporter AzlC
MQDSSRSSTPDRTDIGTNGVTHGLTQLSAAQIKEVEKQSFREAVKDCSPSLIGILAWGVVVGIAMVKTHFTIVQALGMTFTVYAGSAQLATLPLIAEAAPMWVIFLTGLMINLRFVIFSVIIAPHFSHLKFWQRVFWGYMTGDVSMIYFMKRFPTEKPEIGKFAYMKGLFVANWIAWQIGSVAGILIGSEIPENWGVGFAGTLAILCVLLPMVLKQAALVGVIAASVIAVAAFHWPYQLGMVTAVVVGVLCSMGWEEWQVRWQGRGQKRASAKGTHD